MKKQTIKAEEKLKEILRRMVFEDCTGDTVDELVDRYLPKIKKAFGEMFTEAQK